MTWLQFKQAVEHLGAKDEDVVGWIDIYEPMKEDDLFVSVEESGKDNPRTINIMGGT
jgi:hypothetical protein